MDAIDLQILTMLQVAGRTSNAEMARQLEMAPSAILERIRKLEQSGVILGYEARIDPNAIALGLTAFVRIRSEEPKGAKKTLETLVAIPEVLEVHHVAGEDCFLIKVRAKDTRDLNRILRDSISILPKLQSTQTTIVLETHKETMAMPIKGMD